MRIYLTLLISFTLGLTVTSCNGQEQKKTVTEKTTTGTQTQAVVHRVGVADFKTQLGTDAQLVDVRTPAEYAAGHIGEALNYNINGADFKNQIESLDKSKPVLLYCKMGGRSARAAKVLEEMGFTTIYDLAGGYTDWAKQ